MNKKWFVLFALAMTAALLVSVPAFAAEKTYKMRVATVVSPPHPWIDSANFMIKALAEKSKGAIKLTLHASSSLGSDQTTIDEMRMGTIDLVIGGSSPAAVFVPGFQLCSLPYLFKDYDHFMKIIAAGSPFFKALEKFYADRKLNLALLALGGGGVRNCSNNLRPIVKPEDMKGMKMRVPGNPLVTKIWAATGAIPSPMPWNEIYSAMQTGVVNCFESTISGYYGSRYYEVAPYLSKTQHEFMVTHITMSSASLQRLPANYQKLVREVAAEAGALVTKRGIEFDDEKLKVLIEKHKVKVNEVDKQAFVNLFIPMQNELAEKAKLTDLLQKVREIK
jgi:tripartite ATP-independent transporter DctP family solute receptor